MTENHWEHRSFKEQGLDIQPQIHLGAKASAMERAGIQTIRGNINRKIIESNAIILQAKAVYDDAKKSLISVKALASVGAKKVADAIKNEIVDVIKKVESLNKGRLSLPIVGGKYLRLITNRAQLQNPETMEQFVHNMGLTTFEELAKFKKDEVAKYEAVADDRETLFSRQEYIEKLLSVHEEQYAPYKQFNDEKWKLKGFARKLYERKHIGELANYDIGREKLKSMIVEPDKKITPKAWRKELAEIQEKIDATKQPYSQAVMRLASVEVLEHNKKDLERLLHNERSAREKREREQTQQHKRNGQTI